MARWGGLDEMKTSGRCSCLAYMAVDLPGTLIHLYVRTKISFSMAMLISNSKRSQCFRIFVVFHSRLGKCFSARFSGGEYIWLRLIRKSRKVSNIEPPWRGWRISFHGRTYRNLSKSFSRCFSRKKIISGSIGAFTRSFEKLFSCCEKNSFYNFRLSDGESEPLCLTLTITATDSLIMQTNEAHFPARWTCEFKLHVDGALINIKATLTHAPCRSCCNVVFGWRGKQCRKGTRTGHP